MCVRIFSLCVNVCVWGGGEIIISVHEEPGMSAQLSESPAARPLGVILAEPSGHSTSMKEPELHPWVRPVLSQNVYLQSMVL